MENIKCQCDRKHNSCKGKVEERNLKQDFKWDIKSKNYKLILCEYHYSVRFFMKNEIAKLLQK